MTDFLDYKTDGDALFESLKSYIISIGQCAPEKRQERMKQIEGYFKELNSLLTEIEAQYPVWNSENRNAARSYVSSFKNLLIDLRSQYDEQLSNLVNRNLLMQGASEREKTAIEARDEKMDRSLESVNEMKDMGVGLLTELERQSEITNNLDNNLTGMIKQIEYGDTLVHRLTCGERAKKILLWLFIIVFIGFIIVFLYFIFFK